MSEQNNIVIDLSKAITSQQENTTKALQTPTMPALALHRDFSIKSLEEYLPTRTSLRGSFNTTNIENYIKFIKTKKQSGATCFVDSVQMTANTILDIGTQESPLHCNNTARLSLNQTAAFLALLQFEGTHHLQKRTAEWLEEWHEHLSFLSSENEDMPLSSAVAAIRKMKITHQSEMESSVEQTSESRSAMENLDADANKTLPSTAIFTCTPYLGLDEREFILKLSVLTGDSKPKLVFKILQYESILEEITEEFANIIEDALKAEKIETYIGTYQS